jgi:hypothetical protein
MQVHFTAMIDTAPQKKPPDSLFSRTGETDGFQSLFHLSENRRIINRRRDFVFLVVGYLLNGAP